MDNRNLAYIHGFLSGDGYIKNKNDIEIEISIKDINVLNFICDNMNIDRGMVKKRTKEHDQCHTDKTKIYEYARICIKDKLGWFIKPYGDLNENSLKKDRLDYIDLQNISQNKEIQLAWIKGYYDADGCEDNTRLYSPSSIFLNNLKKLFNIPSDVIIANEGAYSLIIGTFKNILINNFNGVLPRKDILINEKYSGKKNMKLIGSSTLEIEKLILSTLVKTHSITEIGIMFNRARSTIFSKCKKHEIIIPHRNGGKKVNNDIKKDCIFYPCHNIDNMTCKYCYCPLNSFKDCGGDYKWIDEESGLKDCSRCIYPHIVKNYDDIIKKLTNLHKGDYNV